MAYKFDATTFDANIETGFITVTIGFDLVDDAVIDPVTGKPTVLVSTSFSQRIMNGMPTADAKTLIAQNSASYLQDFYNKWLNRKNKVVDLLSSNEATLETYINSHVTF